MALPSPAFVLRPVLLAMPAAPGLALWLPPFELAGSTPSLELVLPLLSPEGLGLPTLLTELPEPEEGDEGEEGEDGEDGEDGDEGDEGDEDGEEGEDGEVVGVDGDDSEVAGSSPLIRGPRRGLNTGTDGSGTGRLIREGSRFFKEFSIWVARARRL